MTEATGIYPVTIWIRVKIYEATGYKFEMLDIIYAF